MQQPKKRRSQVDAFRFAFRGLREMLRSEVHARIHLNATVIAIAAALLLGISRLEWIALVLTIAAVWSLEAVNTAIEAICDLVSPEQHPLVARAKDVAAGAVLVAAIASLLIAGLILAPRLIALFQN